MSLKSLEDYEVLNAVEFGSLGACFKIRDKTTGGLFILKAVEYGSLSETKKQMLLNKLKLLSDRQHPNFVRYIDYFIHLVSSTIYIVMEWCPGGSLSTLVEESKKKGELLNEDFIWKMLLQISQALNFYSDKFEDGSDLYRRINSSNIFLDADGNAKLGDYQISGILDLKRLDSDFPIDLSIFSTTDILKNQKSEQTSDVWALGCLILELATLLTASCGSQFLDTNLDRSISLPDMYSDDLRSVLQFMLSVGNAPSSVKMILQHPLVVKRIRSCQWRPEDFNDLFKENCLIRRHKKEKFSNRQKNQLLNLKELPLPEKIVYSENTCEKTFQDKWLSRIETIRKKEAELKKKDERLTELERSLVKREKQTEILEKMAKEKVKRAEIYLRQCKEYRTTRKVKKVKFSPAKRNYKMDTSFSADPGDSSVLLTSAPPKIPPRKICTTKNFDEIKSDQSKRHVTFEKPYPEKFRTGSMAISENKENDIPTINLYKPPVKAPNAHKLLKIGLGKSLSLAALTNKNRNSLCETLAVPLKVNQHVTQEMTGHSFFPKSSSMKIFSKKVICNKHTSL